MPTVLVTGLNGFTGLHMQSCMEDAGYLVRGTCRKPENANDTLIFADLTDYASIENAVKVAEPDYILHFAGLSFAAHPNPSELFNVNLFGTQNLLKAIEAVKPDVKKVVLASSATVYGNLGQEVLNESLCPKPVNFYGSSKLAMEHMARTWSQRLPIIVTRPFNYTGLGQDEKFLIPKIVNAFRHKAPRIELGNTEVSRDFSDVRDVCEKYKSLMEYNGDYTTVNLCSAKLTSLRDIIDMCSKITGHSLEIDVNPAFVRKNEIYKLRGSDTHLKSLIGSHANRPIGDTLSWMLSK